MVLVSTPALRPLVIIDLIVFHLKSKTDPVLLSVVISEIIFFFTIPILAKGFIKIFYI